MQEKISYNNGVSPSSEQQYRERMQQLVRRWQRRRSPDQAQEDVVSFVNWLINCRSGLSAASWRNYKASVVWAMEEIPSNFFKAAACSDVQTALEMLRSTGQRGLSLHADRTSGLKARRVKDKDLIRLEAFFAKSRSRYATFVPMMVRVSNLAGLRPCEWPSARLSVGLGGNAAVLIVENAKHTNGRGHGEFRTIIWEELPDDVVEDLRQWLAYVAESVSGATSVASVWKETMKGLARELYRANKKLWPRRKKHIAPYSARQEYSARLKSVRDPEVAAALMGHAVDDTAYRHYAGNRRSRGHPDKFHVPDANPTEVAKVRKTGWQDKFEDFRGAKAATPKL
ncbi:hypothetical protein GCM10007989_31780 [Devosia pacifica]|uniref:Uncharacterized protein n=1 Tax=Devosia pacifica TaxID=1335967 RepID=A0A918SAU9_9HYPH|nr:hypothetical protein [Devosia pacifica]GHA33243.1 hypothetical protein GCM10007989_31780 [Devosia pacifica]